MHTYPLLLLNYNLHHNCLIFHEITAVTHSNSVSSGVVESSSAGPENIILWLKQDMYVAYRHIYIIITKMLKHR